MTQATSVSPEVGLVLCKIVENAKPSMVRVRKQNNTVQNRFWVFDSRDKNPECNVWYMFYCGLAIHSRKSSVQYYMREHAEQQSCISIKLIKTDSNNVIVSLVISCLLVLIKRFRVPFPALPLDLSLMENYSTVRTV